MGTIISFKNTFFPYCSNDQNAFKADIRNAKVETTVHFLSHCHLYSTQRSELFDNIGKLINSSLNVNKKPQALVLLYGLKRNNSENLNQNIINAVIKYLKSAASFERLIFDKNQETLCCFFLILFCNLICIYR